MRRDNDQDPVASKQGSNVRIRRMSPADIPEVAVLEAQNFSMPWSEKGFDDALKQADNIFLVARTQDGTIAAYCGLYASTDEGEITNVAVSEKVRRQGIGVAVMEELFYRAKERGIKKIFLEVRQSNMSARRLYDKMGFAQCGIRKNFYERPREDAVVMCADIEKNG